MKLRDRVKPEKFAFARKMRKNPTPAERVLWAWLRKDRLGFRFRRQAVLLGWIVDFYCPRRNLVIEVDGAVHKSLREKDKLRSSVLEDHGLKVIRFTNDEVLDNPQKVTAQIQIALRARTRAL